MYRNDCYDNYRPLVPYMPMKPRVGYGYVPYQINPMYYDNIEEGHYYGTMFPELVTPYLEYLNKEV